MKSKSKGKRVIKVSKPWTLFVHALYYCVLGVLRVFRITSSTSTFTWRLLPCFPIYSLRNEVLIQRSNTYGISPFYTRKVRPLRDVHIQTICCGGNEEVLILGN